MTGNVKNTGNDQEKQETKMEIQEIDMPCLGRSRAGGATRIYGESKIFSRSTINPGDF